MRSRCDGVTHRVLEESAKVSAPKVGSGRGDCARRQSTVAAGRICNRHGCGARMRRSDGLRERSIGVVLIGTAAPLPATGRDGAAAQVGGFIGVELSEISGFTSPTWMVREEQAAASQSAILSGHGAPLEIRAAGAMMAGCAELLRPGVPLVLQSFFSARPTRN